MTRKLSNNEQRVLEMVQRASRAGGALTIGQVRERLGSKGGQVHNIVIRLRDAGLIEGTRGEDFRGSVTLRATRGKI